MCLFYVLYYPPTAGVGHKIEALHVKNLNVKDVNVREKKGPRGSGREFFLFRND